MEVEGDFLLALVNEVALDQLGQDRAGREGYRRPAVQAITDCKGYSRPIIPGKD